MADPHPLLLVAALIASFSLVQSVVVDDTCHLSYTALTGDSVCLAFIEEEKTHADAEAYCVARGGHLATIETMAQNNNMFAYADGRALPPQERNAWIGFSRNSAGQWEWIDGSASSFVNWHPSEPSGSGSCVFMMQRNDATYDKMWDDQSCESNKYFWCAYYTKCDIRYSSLSGAEVCVEFNHDAELHNDAKASCEASENGYLATIETEQQNLEMTTFVDDASDGNDAWIGFTPAAGGGWDWMDGSEATYNNWATNEPSGSGDCVLLMERSDGLDGYWDDTDCDAGFSRKFWCSYGCPPGYRGNGINCQQVDECALGTHACDSNAHCTDEDGSYGCACTVGYFGDGTTCTQCPANQYQDQRGQSSCVLCDGGKTAPPGSVSASQCAALTDTASDASLDLGKTSTLRVAAVSFDTSASCGSAAGCWKIQVIYSQLSQADTTVLYLPKTGTYDTTKSTINFPCSMRDYSPSTPSSSETICCFKAFADTYTTLDAFQTYVAGLDTDFAGGGACSGASGSTLIDSAQDAYVIGTYSSSGVTVGNQQAVGDQVYQATITIEADQVDMIGTETQNNPAGGSYQHQSEIYVGLAEFFATGTRILNAVNQQVKVSLARSFYGTVTTTGSTEYTFINRVDARVHQVRDSGGDFAYFVSISVMHDAGLTADAGGLFPLDSIVVTSGGLGHVCAPSTVTSDFTTTIQQPECGPAVDMCTSVSSSIDNLGFINIPLVGFDPSASSEVNLELAVVVRDGAVPYFSTLKLGLDVSDDRFVKWCEGSTPEATAVSFTVELLYSKADFDNDESGVQTNYIEAVAASAGVNSAAVTIAGTTATTVRRRLLADAVLVDTIISTASASAAAAVASAVTEVALNVALAAVGVTAGTITSASATFDPTSSTVSLTTGVNVKMLVGATEGALANLPAATLAGDGSAAVTAPSKSISGGMITLVVEGEALADANLQVKLEDVITVHVNGDSTTLSGDLFQVVYNFGTNEVGLNPTAEVTTHCEEGTGPDGDLIGNGVESNPLDTCAMRRDVKRGLTQPGLSAEITDGTEVAAFLQTVSGDSSTFSQDLGNTFGSLLFSEYLDDTDGDGLGKEKNSVWLINPGFNWQGVAGSTIFSLSAQVHIGALFTVSTAGSRRRVLLQATAGRQGASSGTIQYDVDAAALTASVMGVSVDRVAVWRIALLLDAGDACRPAAELEDVSKQQTLAALRAVSGDVLNVFVASVAVDQRDALCDSEDDNNAIAPSVLVEAVLVFRQVEDGHRIVVDMDEFRGQAGILSALEIQPSPLVVTSTAPPEQQLAQGGHDVKTLVAAVVAASLGALLLLVIGRRVYRSGCGSAAAAADADELMMATTVTVDLLSAGVQPDAKATVEAKLADV